MFKKTFTRLLKYLPSGNFDFVTYNTSIFDLPNKLDIEVVGNNRIVYNSYYLFKWASNETLDKIRSIVTPNAYAFDYVWDDKVTSWIAKILTWVTNLTELKTYEAKDFNLYDWWFLRVKDNPYEISLKEFEQLNKIDREIEMHYYITEDWYLVGCNGYEWWIIFILKMYKKIENEKIF